MRAREWDYLKTDHMNCVAACAYGHCLNPSGFHSHGPCDRSGELAKLEAVKVPVIMEPADAIMMALTKGLRVKGSAAGWPLDLTITIASEQESREDGLTSEEPQRRTW